MKIGLRRSASLDPGDETTPGAAKREEMLFSHDRRLPAIAIALVACGLAACSGNLGSGGIGGGLPAAPGAQGYQQPQGPGSAGPVSRERQVEGAVFQAPEMRAIPLPAVDGFGLVLALGTPPPAPSPTPVASAMPAATSLRRHTSRVVQIAQALLSTSAPAGSPAGSPVASGSPAPGPSGSPAPVPSASAHASPHPSPTGPRIDTKLVIYPNYAPDAPTPEPTGNVQTFTKRTALVRGYVHPAADLPLYGLGAARFTIPLSEQTVGRGYTIAVFTTAKHKKAGLIASDTSVAFANGVVSSTLTTPLTLKKGTGYDIVLYGDPMPSTPAPVPSGYATPGTNPFVTPVPSGYAAPPTPFGATPTPYGATPTPYPGH